MSDPIQLSPTHVSFLNDATGVAQYVGLEAIVFRPGLVSGIGGNSGMAIVMVHTHNEDLPFDGMGVTSPADLKNRLQLIAAQKGSVKVVAVDGKLDDDPTTKRIAAKLMFNAGRMKMVHNTGNPKAIKAPKRISFVENWRVSFDQDTVLNTLNNATKVLSIDNDTLVAITSVNGEAVLQITDRNGDQYEDVMGTPDGTPFSHRYPLKHFVSLIKGHGKNIDVCGSKEGTMRFSISGFSVFLLPKV